MDYCKNFYSIFDKISNKNILFLNLTEFCLQLILCASVAYSSTVKFTKNGGKKWIVKTQ